MKTHRLALENRLGQTARIIDWHQDLIHVVYLRNKRRLELVGELDSLQRDEIDLDLIQTIDLSRLTSSGASIPGFGILRRSEGREIILTSAAYTYDSQEELKPIFKWTSIAHFGFIGLLILSSWIFKPQSNETKPELVYISESLAEIKAPAPVEVSEQKISKTKIDQRRFSNRTTEGRKALRTTKKSPQRLAKLQRTIEVENMGAVGALGALGGTKFGNVKSAGLSLTAKNISRGTGSPGGGVGLGGAGGIDSAIPGKGLVGTAIGNGGPIRGGGGYGDGTGSGSGTRGKGGGQTGYGAFSFAGSSGGYSLPLEEEALVEGGLDRDQISAIIQKNLGQIVYCYEKGLQTKPGLSGRVGVNFVIGGQGFVRRAGISSSSLRHASVENCILSKLKSWKFPKPHGQVDVRVTYPFVLKRVSQG